MKKTIALFLFLILITANLFALDPVVINGEEIPVYPNARKSVKQDSADNAQMIRYISPSTFETVKRFYLDFLQQNDYQVLGGDVRADLYNAMVQKGDTRFSLKIYAAGSQTFIELVW